MPNRLAQSNSPYLLQHADNPVDWYPWGDKAFAKARAEDKPLFLSIGYATCHWCHVMEHESFEDAEVAGLMNEAFVNVKVDREERPDIDGVYMAVAQALTGRGGWPLTILMTPEGEPFFAGTYIPRESSHGRIGMLDLVPRVAELWHEDRDRVLASASEITTRVRDGLATSTPGTALGEEALDRAYEQLAERADPVFGGFGRAPKFPTPHNLLFLLRYARRHPERDALAMVETTLQAMRRGGIWDHIGFGFHRYSTDRTWLLPHFEKMLYDQALLAMAYTEAFQATGTPEYRTTAEQIIAYVTRDLLSPEGAFYSAEDADSLNAEGEREEGAFYIWSEAELTTLLGEEDAALARQAFGTQPEGNFLEEATRVKTGANVLHHPQALADLAVQVGASETDLRSRLASIRTKLFAARTARPRPLLDDKILTDWNGLMIAALAKAARAFGEAEYTRQATRAADFLLATMRTSEGRLLHRYRSGEAGITGHLDDYAFLAWGLFELYEATFDEAYLREALALHRTMHERFADAEAGGYFFTDAEGEALIARQKEYYDGAIPSGNAVAMLNGLRLGRITGDNHLEREAERVGASAAEILVQPMAHTFAMVAVDFAVGPAQEVVIAGERDAPDTAAMIEGLNGIYAPNTIVLLRAPGTGEAPIAGLVPFAAEQTASEGQATAYVCEHYACQAPTTDPAAMLQLLRGAVQG
ncbi:MAG: thioredoxin domain-containing protein [Rhodothermaceae bacterium]|nr:thioredoxin domain-containing protein [Rhodothermaceae bacterium]